jgi:hypothetical protein
MEPPQLESIAQATDGNMELKVKCWNGFAWVVEASNDLRLWTSVATVTNENGRLRFDDPAAHRATRFYRLVAP